MAAKKCKSHKLKNSVLPVHRSRFLLRRLVRRSRCGAGGSLFGVGGRFLAAIPLTLTLLTGRTPCGQTDTHIIKLVKIK